LAGISDGGATKLWLVIFTLASANRATLNPVEAALLPGVGSVTCTVVTSIRLLKVKE
jgi:hypothetical protein